MPAESHPLDILCVEDDPDIARVLQLMVEAVPGARALVAEDGRTALSLAERRRPRVAFVDLGLPDVDGLELLRELRARCPGLAIVVVTAYHERRQEALRAGASAFLGKPFDPEQVVQLVSRLSRDGASA
ncbi:MAG TPA: response regulator [Thermodesulfobacteriota bacterium]|nr:response regulator [Thermodesulfobacteriota bacterium]